MIPLTDKENKSHGIKNVATFAKKGLLRIIKK